ncbi:hypothetical protein CR513_14513, partial [Mucuna pruriens]
MVLNKSALGSKANGFGLPNIMGLLNRCFPFGPCDQRNLINLDSSSSSTIVGGLVSTTTSSSLLEEGQFQERLDPIEASRLKRTRPDQIVPSQPSPASRPKSLQRRVYICNHLGDDRSNQKLKPIVSHTPHTLALVPFPSWYTVLQYSVSSIEEVQSESSQFEIESTFYVPSSQEPKPMVNNDRTLKELATSDVVYQPWCIQYPQLEPAQSYELKSDLIHLLPKFHGLVGEDRHKHLKEFHGILEDYIKMKVFPFSLDGVAKD